MHRMGIKFAGIMISAVAAIFITAGIAALAMDYEVVGCSDARGNPVPCRDYNPAPPPDPQQERRQKAASLNNEGNEFWKIHNYDAAIQKYKEALAYSPDDKNIQDNLNKVQAAQFNNEGNKYWKAHNHDAAIQKYEEALRFSPDDKNIQDNLRNAQAVKEQNEESSKIAAYFTKGIEYEKNNNFAAAIQNYNEALKYDPNNKWFKGQLESAKAAQVRQLLQGLSEQAKKYEDKIAAESLESLEKSLQFYKTQSNISFDRGNKYWKTKDYDAAIQEYTTALAFDPENKVTRDNLKSVQAAKANALAKTASRKVNKDSKKAPSSTSRISKGLEFPKGNPPQEEVVVELSPMSPRPINPATNRRAGDQLISAATFNGSVGTQDQASQHGRSGFDDQNKPAGSLPTVNISTSNRNAQGDPIVSKEQRTAHPKIAPMEKKRDQLREKFKGYQNEVKRIEQDMRTTQDSAVRDLLFKKRADVIQLETNTKSEIDFNDYGIVEELRKPPELPQQKGGK